MQPFFNSILRLYHLFSTTHKSTLIAYFHN